MDPATEEVDPPPYKLTSPTPPQYSMAPAPCSSSPLSFQPRPFPPPSLADVPVDYIIDQLHTLASSYWDRPDTADCTLIVPFPHATGSMLAPDFAAGSPSSSTMLHNTASARRATQPPMNATPRMTLKLHVDYLSAHSSYLRGLFSGARPLDLMFSSTPPTLTSHPVFGNSPIPANRLPRLMPCSPEHPILYLPVPDPSSLQLLIHWMYFGDLSFIDDALCKGVVEFDGIALNVEYLGLSSRIRVFLTEWYTKWLGPLRACPSYERDDSGTVCNGDDDTASTTSSESQSEFEFELEELKEPCRGRDRVMRPLSFQTFSSAIAP